nr:12145_t:CDS:2 [Entrophospora candida]
MIFITSSEIDERIIKRIKIISKLKSFPESEQILKKFYANDRIYSNDLVDSIQFALRAFTEKLTRLFSSNQNFYQIDLSEGHLNRQIYFDLVNDLFYDSRIYNVHCQRDTEILIIEQAKYKIVDDKFKACIEMHDMLYLVEECNKSVNLRALIFLDLFPVMNTMKTLKFKQSTDSDGNRSN